MPHSVAYLHYQSVAELYGNFVREFVLPSPIVSACGCRIHCYEHHFVHMVKLFGPSQAKLDFPTEKPTIMTTIDGFGDYTHEERRGLFLMAALECLRNPDLVVRPKHLKTADRAFLMEIDTPTYPYMVVLVRNESGHITLCTGHPLRKRHVQEWLEAEVLYSKTAQPPVKAAV
jgi:hypothetical protein